MSHLSGRIIPQSGSDLDNIGVLFSNFLAGQNQTLTVQGTSVQPVLFSSQPSKFFILTFVSLFQSGSSEPVAWLSAAFKTLTLEVILPGQTFTIITAINIDQLALTMVNQDQAFAPPASSDFTLAKYKNPFGFSLQVVESAQELLISDLGLDIARVRTQSMFVALLTLSQLTIPMTPTVGGVSTGNEADLVISFHDLPLVAVTENGFELLFAVALLLPSTDFVLSGSANVSARTTIGDVPINGIPFNLPSTLEGKCFSLS